MSLSRVLGHHVYPGWHEYDVAWSQQESETVLQECGIIFPQISPPIHISLMEAETVVFGTSPDSPTNALYEIEVRRLGGPWKMGNFILMLLKPTGDNTCHGLEQCHPEILCSQQGRNAFFFLHNLYIQYSP